MLVHAVGERLFGFVGEHGGVAASFLGTATPACIENPATWAHGWPDSRRGNIAGVGPANFPGSVSPRPIGVFGQRPLD